MKSLALPFVLAAALVLALTGCAPSAPSDDRPLVVATTNILGDVVANVVGDEAEVMTLMKPGADPHSFEISAQEASRILSADLIVSSGLGLEEGLAAHLDAAAAEGVPVLVAGDAVETLPYASGESAGTVDPHWWTDPGRTVDVVSSVSEAVGGVAESGAVLDPAVITANAESYTAQLSALETDMTEAFAAIGADRRALVTNHHVFGYLAERFDFTVIGAVIPSGSTLAAPSASDLRDLVSAIDAAGVSTIFAESSQPDRLVQVLADEADLAVDVVELFTESLTGPDGEAPDYLTMMRVNTDRIATGLSP